MTYRARVGVAVVWAITVAAAISSVVLLAMSWDRALTDDVFSGFGGLSFAAMSIAFASTGAIIAERVVDHAVGRLFLLIGLLLAVGLLGYQYAAYGLTRPGGVPAMATVAWLYNPISQPAAALIGLSLMLFPDGRLASARWRKAAAMGWLAAALVSVPVLLEPGSLPAPFASLSSPLDIAGIREAMIGAGMVGWVLAVAGIGLGAMSLAVRLRRSRGEVRQQLKLVLAVGAVVAAATTLDMLTWFPWPHGELAVRIGIVGVLLSVFAVAVGVAATRYRLYDVDIAIERTAVYGALTFLLAAAYAVTALALGTALGSDSDWVTAGATLVAAVAFRPLRSALQDLVDRRFSRARYEAIQRVAEFLERLRSGQSAPEEIEPLLRELLSDPDLEMRFFLPESEVYVDAAGMQVHDDPGDARVRTPVLRAGAPVAMVLHRPTGPQRPDPLVTLVEAGGLAIEIARLRVELRRQLAEVQASRARIVAAGNAERRRHRARPPRRRAATAGVDRAAAAPRPAPARLGTAGSRRRDDRSCRDRGRDRDRRAARAGARTTAGAARRRPRSGAARAGRSRAAARPGPHDHGTVQRRARGGGVLHRVRGPDQRDQALRRDRGRGQRPTEQRPPDRPRHGRRRWRRDRQSTAAGCTGCTTGSRPTAATYRSKAPRTRARS